MSNDELRKKLAEYLDQIAAATKEGGEFAAEQAPLVAQEYVDWYFWSSFYLALVWAIVLFALIWLAFWSCRTGQELSQNGKSAQSEPYAFVSIISCIFSIGPMTGVAIASYWMLYATLAPRVLILEKIAELI